MPSIDDLRPKEFTITVSGVHLQCKPVRLRHAMAMAKVGNIFNDLSAAKQSDIDDAEKQLQSVIRELIPAIDFEPDMQTSLDIMTKLMEGIEPTENAELRENGVSFDSPKAPTPERTTG